MIHPGTLRIHVTDKEEKMMIDIGMEDVSKRFGSFCASDHVSFSIEKGSLSALLGPSGSGKTTILRLLAGLEKPDSGRIYINGQVVNNVPAAQRGIGFVFQNYALFRHMNVYDNVAFGLQVQKCPRKEIAARTMELLELTELAELKNRYPDELSGGQRQRVAFARALAPRPQILLLDEPFAAIDAKVRRELRSWLRQMIHKVGITSIFVTHDQEEAAEVADRILIVNEGRIEQSGAGQEVYKSPQTPFVAEFMGNSQVIEHFPGFPGFEEAAGKRVVLRPEFIDAFQSDNSHFSHVLPCTEEGTIRDILFRGNYLEMHLEVNGMRLISHRSLERRQVHPGDRMRVVLYRILCEDGDGVRLLENEMLKQADPDQEQIELYQYGDNGYFTV